MAPLHGIFCSLVAALLLLCVTTSSQATATTNTTITAATKALAQNLLHDVQSTAEAVAASLAPRKKSAIAGMLPLDRGSPTTLLTSVNGSNTVTCARDRQCYAPEFRVAAGGIPAGFSQLATNWTDTRTNVMTISKIPFVDGAVSASQITPAGSVFSVTADADFRHLVGNGLPSTPMGSFPVQPGTAAYPYYAALPGGTDPSTGQPYRPNGTADEIYVAPYNLTSTIPLRPVPTGYYPINALIVGVTLTGAVWHIEGAADSNNNWYNPSNVLPMDQCFGHPYRNQYHHHAYSWRCFPAHRRGKALSGGGGGGGAGGSSGGIDAVGNVAGNVVAGVGNDADLLRSSLPFSLAAGLHSPLYGYALDGFGIYGPLDVDGKMISNARLDRCHGHVGPVAWDGGRVVEMYHYHLNREYPYSVGCFRGKVNYYQALGSLDMRETNYPIYYDGPYPP